MTELLVTAFVVVFGGLAVVAVVAALRRRREALAGHPPGGELDPYEIAFLAGGPALAVTAALGALRAHGAIETARHGVLAASGPLPGGATPLDVAVYEAVARGRTTRADRLHTDGVVRQVLAELARRLDHAGLLLDDDARRRAGTANRPLLAVVLLSGAAALAFFPLNGGLTTILLLMFGFAPLNLLYFLVNQRGIPWRSRGGDAALGTARTRYRHLAPASTPAWGTYGPGGAAMAVGLYGGAAFWAADPAFAAAAGVPRKVSPPSRRRSSSTDGGSGCSSGCGSDSGSGCGGGCGGGGGD